MARHNTQNGQNVAITAPHSEIQFTKGDNFPCSGRIPKLRAAGAAGLAFPAGVGEGSRGRLWVGLRVGVYAGACGGIGPEPQKRVRRL